jgi:hypothetical protein
MVVFCVRVRKWWNEVGVSQLLFLFFLQMFNVGCAFLVHHVKQDSFIERGEKEGEGGYLVVLVQVIAVWVVLRQGPDPVDIPSHKLHGWIEVKTKRFTR